VSDAGTITLLGLEGKYPYENPFNPAPAINDNGEIAVTLEIDNGPRAVAILTPPAR
jgi:hypothetical protein